MKNRGELSARGISGVLSLCPREYVHGRCPDPIGPLCVCLSAGLLQSNQPVLLTFGVMTGPTYRKNLTAGGDAVPYTDSGSLSTSLTIAEQDIF